MRPEIAHLFSQTAPQAKSISVKHTSPPASGGLTLATKLMIQDGIRPPGFMKQWINTREEKKGQFKRRKNTAANIQVYIQAKTLRREVTHNLSGLSHLLHGRLNINTLANSQVIFCCYLLNPWQVLDGEGMAIHSSILAWRIPMDRGAWQATVHRIGHDWSDLA